ncbi:MAG: thioredoxin domain-containing protein [Verrucomicrobiaceae bacterium]
MKRITLILVSLALTAVAKEEESGKKGNRLLEEKSPYLLLHAYNPVDWYPWGEEAFKKARDEKKLILLSVGYSTCHWCHVMERESFENEEIASYLNEHFVSIKLDREERPDVDQVYMTAFQAMTGQGGGWPLNMFLTPDLKPLTGGTYFPPKDEGGRPGFQTVLKKVHAVWEGNPEETAKNAGLGFAELEKHFAGMHALEAGAGELTGTLLKNGVAGAVEQVDPVWGGLGKDQKFPQASVFRLMLQAGDEKAREAALMSVRRMLDGGIYDQVGGGIHRYAVDREWLIPHFEKMLYDQAQVVELFLDAWQVTGEKRFAEAAEGTVEFVLREMRHPEGGFYCARDAQSEGKEGKYFCWTVEELKEVLSGDELVLAREVLGVTEKGNFVDHSDPEALPNLNVLHFAKRRGELGEGERQAVDGILGKLLEVRLKRVPPPTDDKILASWNGLMIGALARAGFVLQKKEYVEAAEKAHAFVEEKLLGADGELSHRWREGEKDATKQAESYVHFMRGSRKLYEVTLKPTYLERAIGLGEKVLVHFFDEKNGGVFQGEAREDLVFRLKGDFDAALPTESSVAAREFAILTEMTGRKDFHGAAEKTLRAYVPLMKEAPSGMGEMLRSLDFYVEKPARLVIAGEAGREEMLAVAAGHWDPTMIVLGTSGPLDEFTLGLKPVAEKATAYYCVGQTCQLPVNEPEKLGALLKRMK